MVINIRTQLIALRGRISPDAAGGLALALCAVVAMVIANSPWHDLYARILDTQVSVSVGEAGLEKPFLMWVNDGLMAIFFLLVGLELKRAVLQGELADMSKAVLPAIAAVGGMVVPVVIYSWINWGSEREQDVYTVSTSVASAH